MNAEVSAEPVVGTPLSPPRARARALPSLPFPLLAGLAILAAWVLISALVPPLVGRSPEETTLGTKLLAPSPAYLFGTDALGRDVLVRTAVAFRYDLLIAVVSVAGAAVAGLFLGAVAGSSPEWLDNVIMRVLDVVSAFPSFILALMLAAALGPSVITLVISLAFVLAPQYAQGTRAAILAERHKPYADAARAMAIPPARIVFVHLLPNSLGPTVTQMAMDATTAIVVAAGLSFIGFGVQPPTPEWGLMINEGSSYIVSGQWWVTFFPGLAILSVVVALFSLDGGLKRLRGGH
jgi:dipeptide transport system permease protein